MDTHQTLSRQELHFSRCLIDEDKASTDQLLETLSLSPGIDREKSVLIGVDPEDYYPRQPHANHLKFVASRMKSDRPSFSGSELEALEEAGLLLPITLEEHDTLRKENAELKQFRNGSISRINDVTSQINLLHIVLEKTATKGADDDISSVVIRDLDLGITDAEKKADWALAADQSSRAEKEKRDPRKLTARDLSYFEHFNEVTEIHIKDGNEKPVTKLRRDLTRRDVENCLISEMILKGDLLRTHNSMLENAKHIKPLAEPVTVKKENGPTLHYSAVRTTTFYRSLAEVARFRREVKKRMEQESGRR